MIVGISLSRDVVYTGTGETKVDQIIHCFQNEDSL